MLILPWGPAGWGRQTSSRWAPGPAVRAAGTLQLTEWELEQDRREWREDCVGRPHSRGGQDTSHRMASVQPASTPCLPIPSDSLCSVRLHTGLLGTWRRKQPPGVRWWRRADGAVHTDQGSSPHLASQMLRSPGTWAAGVSGRKAERPGH